MLNYLLVILYNSTWNKEYALWIHDEKIYVLNSKNGQKIKEISLSDSVVVTEYSESLKKYVKRINVDLNSEGVDVALTSTVTFLLEALIFYYHANSS